MEAFLSDQQLALKGHGGPVSGGRAREHDWPPPGDGPSCGKRALEEYGKRLRDILRLPAPIPLRPNEGPGRPGRHGQRRLKGAPAPGGISGAWGEGKLAGNTLRIAGLLTLFEFKGLTIREHNMQGAIHIARWFAANMIALVGARELSSAAEEMLRYLTRREQSVSMASVHRAKPQALFQGRGDRAPLQELAANELVRLHDKEQESAYGRPFKPMVPSIRISSVAKGLIVWFGTYRLGTRR